MCYILELYPVKRKFRNWDLPNYKDKYTNFKVGLKCILMVFPYLLLCSYINEM